MVARILGFHGPSQEATHDSAKCRERRIHSTIAIVRDAERLLEQKAELEALIQKMRKSQK